MFRKDFKSDTWDRLSAHINLRIEELRTQLEQRTNTEHSTAATRGAITELRSILALEKAPKEEPRPGDRIGQSAGVINPESFLASSPDT